MARESKHEKVSWKFRAEEKMNEKEVTPDDGERNRKRKSGRTEDNLD